MRAIKLESKSMEEYLLKIKGYADDLVGVGMPLINEQKF